MKAEGLPQADLARTVIPVIFLLSQICFFTVFAVYNGNAEEFTVPLPVLLWAYVPYALTIAVLISAITLILPGDFRIRLVAIIFALATLLYLQGNVLVWQYGLLDGEVLELDQGSWRGFLDGSIWIAVLIAALFRPKLFYRVSLPASLLLMLLQGGSVIGGSVQNSQIWQVPKNYTEMFPPDEIYEFSAKGNLVHLVLDSFQSDIFEEIVKSDPGYYRRELSGFTFYRNALSDFPTTSISIPAMLSGKPYLNHMPMRAYSRRTMMGQTITNSAIDEGLEVDLIFARQKYSQGKYTNKYRIPTAYAVQEQAITIDAESVANLVLFRSVPHFVKPFIYHNQKWLVRMFPDEGGVSGMPPFAMMRVSHSRFFEDFIQGATVGARGYTYKLIHIHIPHPSIVFNEECTITGDIFALDRGNFSVQAKCTLDILLALLDKMRDLGIYEDSTIVVHADHGQGFPLKMNGRKNGEEGPDPRIAGRASALLAVKLPGGTGDLRTSESPVMISDIPATVAAILGLDKTFPGRPVMNLGESEKRERKTYDFDWTNAMKIKYFREMVEYTVDGDLYNSRSWKKTGRLLPPSESK